MEEKVTTRCPDGTCIGKPTKSGLWFCIRCSYSTITPTCYRIGCREKATVLIVDKLAIDPYKPACATHQKEYEKK